VNKTDKAKKPKSIGAYEGEPYDSTDSGNPWLLNNNKKEWIKDPLLGKKLSADYIWSLNKADRKHLVQRVFAYYRNKVSFEELVKPNLSKEKLEKEYQKLCKADVFSCVNEQGEIKNSNSTCTNILKEFVGPLFYSSRGHTKSSRSCREVYEDDELLTAVLKNRMGWKTTKEDGQERPYVFAISNKMIIQGMRSSGLAYMTSTFKPLVAKHIYSRYMSPSSKANNNLVFDYSAGWGARALGAGASGLEYWGIDPLTSVPVNRMMSALGIKGKVLNGCSEDKETYKQLVNAGLKNSFRLAFSSPPYFDLEIYKDDKKQSSSRYPSYDKWLEKYWLSTLENIKEFVLPKEEQGTLILAMINKVKKYDIATDTVEICKSNGFTLKEFLPLKTAKSHLSGKKKSGVVQKTTEGIYVFEA